MAERPLEGNKKQGRKSYVDNKRKNASLFLYNMPNRPSNPRKSPAAFSRRHSTA
jgi:hypothetical protein